MRGGSAESGRNTDTRYATPYSCAVRKMVGLSSTSKVVAGSNGSTVRNRGQNSGCSLTSANHGVKIPGQPGFLHFQRQTVLVGVRDQHHSLAGGAQRIQKLPNIGMHGDQVLDLALQCNDIERQILRPIVQTVPVQRPFNSLGAGLDFGVGLREL